MLTKCLLILLCLIATAEANKVLVIITGSVRGSDLAHKSLELHLLKPYNADLFLCTGESDDHSPYIYQLATYLHEYPLSENWRTTTDTISQHLFGHTLWRNYSAELLGEGLLGCYDAQDHWTGSGSGLLVLASRYYAWQWLGQSGILDHYDAFVVSRSDYYYLADHPDIARLLSSKSHIAIPFIHEDFAGICDRHAVLDRLGLEAYLTALKPFLEFHPENGPYTNDEQVLHAALCKYHHFTPLRYRMPAYMVRPDNDQTVTWSPGSAQDANGLWIKQYGEHEEATRCVSRQPPSRHKTCPN